MQDQSTPVPLTPRNGVLTLTGYGIRVAVERGHLIVEDGIGRERRSGRFSRVARDIKRVVVVGHTGTISFDALRWLHDIGAAFVQIDADGNVIVASGPVGLDDAKLRRAQALAVSNGVGMAIARDLVREKCVGHLTILRQLPNATAAIERIGMMLTAIQDAPTAERLRIAEADAAREFWRAWSAIPLRFARGDVGRIPEHWRTFGARTSALTASPRSATNPANALLNYLYAILEAEARIAALTVGLDPGMGMLHADLRARDSLACDLMEAVRPQVDAFALDLLTTRTFRARDFFENRQGVCRVLPPLTTALAETAPRWSRAIAPIAERVGTALFTDAMATRPHHTTRVPTPLTQANRSAGRDRTRRRARRDAPSTGPALPNACRGCGEVLSTPERGYCDACLAERREEHVATLSEMGPQALARLREAGQDPTNTAEAKRKKAAHNARHMAEVAAWEWEHPERPDPDTFGREILPSLRDVPLSTMMRATGLSLRYCSLIRQGLRVPHPRHWRALVTLNERA